MVEVLNMTKEERQLLLKDLCARLSYGVIVNVPIIDGSENKKLVSIINEDDGIPCVSVYSYEVRNSNGKLVSYEKSTYLLCDIKPYLRPMSSMTDEEKTLMTTICLSNAFGNVEGAVSELSDFYNSRYFDYRGLIPMGLALEAPDDMYKTK